MPAGGASLHTTFERRAIIKKNGDIDEFFSLVVSNVGCAPYSFAEHSPWVCFRVTDSPAEYVSAYDSAEDKQWLSEHRSDGLIVGTQPLADLSPGGVRSFGAHIHRRGRLLPFEHEIHFADPFLYCSRPVAHLGQEVYRAIAIFPERVDGWALSTPLPDAEITSRTVTWEFPYSPEGVKQIAATARIAPRGTPKALLLYDDILAELHTLIAQDACARPLENGALLAKLRHGGEWVQAMAARLQGISELPWWERMTLLREVHASMTAERIPFSRSVQVEVHDSHHLHVEAGQHLSHVSAGRDVIQVTKIQTTLPPTYQGRRVLERVSMAKKKKKQQQQQSSKQESAGQTMEDVSAGGDVTQQTDSATDGQAIRRLKATGDVAQKKAATPQMSFSTTA
jgi:hypothetical protein